MEVKKFAITAIDDRYGSVRPTDMNNVNLTKEFQKITVIKEKLEENRTEMNICERLMDTVEK